MRMVSDLRSNTMSRLLLLLLLPLTTHAKPEPVAHLDSPGKILRITVELDDGSLLTVWYEKVKEHPKAVLRQARWTLG